MTNPMFKILMIGTKQKHTVPHNSHQQDAQYHKLQVQLIGRLIVLMMMVIIVGLMIMMIYLIMLQSKSILKLFVLTEKTVLFHGRKDMQVMQMIHLFIA